MLIHEEGVFPFITSFFTLSHCPIVVYTSHHIKSSYMLLLGVSFPARICYVTVSHLNNDLNTPVHFSVWKKLPIYEKRVAVGGTHFLKCLGRNIFGEELKILGFAWGGVEPTLDDTMVYSLCFKDSF